MSITAPGWSIRNPVPTLVLFLVLTLAGIVSFLQLGIDANPNIDLPIVTIETAYAGAGPQELETQFTKKVEDAVAGLGDVDEIYSSVSDGYAYTAVRFDLGAETDEIMDGVRDAIARIREDLAPYAESMTIQQLRYDDGAILTYAVRSETQPVEALSDLVDRTISPALMSVKGVAEVERIGGVDREISVALDAGQLNAYGISAAQVNEQVKEFNRNLPGGRSQVSGQEQSVRALGRANSTAESLAALRSLSIDLPTGETVPLQSLAAVTDGPAEVREGAIVDSQPVVSFGVFRSNGSLLATVEDGVVQEIAQLEETLPDDVQLQLIFTRATDVREAYKASIEALLLGSVLAVVVVGCFLRNWRTTLITAVALPLSIIPTFTVINALGYSLNSMTLLALTLAVGNLVDDAIVEIENIERHIAMGKPPTQAAIDSSAEVGLAVVTTTATVVAVFIPVAFMGGIPGQFFQPFGVTVAVSTMFSTLVARFVTPLLASRILLAAPEGQSGQSGHSTEETTSQRGGYRWLLGRALRHRLVTLGVAIAIFASSLALIPHIPTGLYGAGDTDLSQLKIELPPGTTFERADEITRGLSDRLLTHPAVESVYVAQNVDESEMVIRLKPKGERDISRQDFEQQVRGQLQRVPDIRFGFDNQSPGGGSEAFSVVLKSANPQSLNQTANQLAQQMREIPGLVEVSTSIGLVKPELLIRPNAQQAADLGVKLRDIATTATLATLGDRDANLSEIDAGDRQIPIRTRLAPEFRTDLAAISNIQVASNRQQLVPLSAVAEVSIGGGTAEIERFDRARQVTVGANLQGISLGQALDAVYALPVLQNLPDDVSEQTAGDADILQDVFSRFAIALGTAIVMIYAVLVLLYNSFIYPLAVMSALPLSIGGTFIALMLTHKPLDLYALIGIVLLMGLVTKNSILLVDYALQAKESGQSLKQAAISSGVTRLRPILMTSISTVAGMVPIALELGAGGEVRSPMAIAVIGGFSTATLLTLVVVPVCFTYIAGLQQRLGRWTYKIGQLFNRRLDSNLAYAYGGAQPEGSPFITESQHKDKLLAVKDLASKDLASRDSAPIDDSERREAMKTSAAIAIKPQPDRLSEPEKTVYTIACIEDDFPTLCNIHNYLGDTVFSLLPVDDPVTALTDLVYYQPDIILLTTSMPGLNAFEVCDRLRKNPTFRTVPILLMVPKANWFTRLKAKWYGASACLGKPLDRTQLLIKLFLMLV